MRKPALGNVTATQRRVTGFIAGVVAFTLLHLIEVQMWAAWFGGKWDPWFLNEGHAVGFMVAGLFGLSLIGGWYRLQGRMITLGAWAAMAIVLAAEPNGPGNIAPIVLTFGGMCASFGCGLGAWIGKELRNAVGRSSRG